MQAKNKFINGREILFLVCQNYAKADEDVQILEFRDLLAVKLWSDNLVDFIHRWEKCLFALRNRPTDDILLALFSDEVAKCGHLKHTLELIKLQDIHSGEKMKYQRLLTICKTHIEQRRKEKLRNEAYSGADAAASGGNKATPAAKRQAGDCLQWRKGNCSRGHGCPYDHDSSKQGIDGRKPGRKPSKSPHKGGKRQGGKGKHKPNTPGDGTEQQQPPRTRSPSKGKGKGGKRNKSQQPRDSPPKHSPRGLTPQRKDFRGRSPSGARNRPICNAYITTGECHKGNQCQEVHLGTCHFYNKTGGCRNGRNCIFRHPGCKSPRAPSNQPSPGNGNNQQFVAITTDSPLNQ